VTVAVFEAERKSTLDLRALVLVTRLLIPHLFEAVKFVSLSGTTTR